eukprot:m.90078 g.90078  ORF g.90078 m.90078 type:complete len:463 (+) comp26363_c0_seq1:154-1542(+)
MIGSPLSVLTLGLALEMTLSDAAPPVPTHRDAATSAPANSVFQFSMPSLREEAEIRKEWIDYRVREILPGLMIANNVQHWILSQREYHEDVVWRSVASPTSINARRRTVMLYSLQDDNTIETKSLVSFEDSIWADLDALLTSTSGKIAINIDEVFAFSDGLAAGEYTALSQGLSPATMARIVQTPLLALDFIALRAPSMITYYRSLTMEAHAIIEGAFTTRVITVGVTTCNDVRWWMREQILEKKLAAGFHPSFNIQRQGVQGSLSDDTVILRGDLLWCDFGHIGMGLWTDTQHMGYVLNENEEDIPAGLVQGFALSNKAQDSVISNLIPGRTGNEVLSAVVTDMTNQGIESIIYCHPIGDHMHGAGATIGLFDYDNGPVPVKGDVKVLANSWYSVELQVRHRVPEWNNQLVEFRQEEDAAIDVSGRVSWVLKRQSALYVIKPSTTKTHARVAPSSTFGENI